MEWKMFETKGRFSSVKQKVFKSVRLILCLREDCNISSPTPVSTVAPYEPVNQLANFSWEAEFKKAQALMYQRMLDRPK